MFIFGVHAREDSDNVRQRTTYLWSCLEHEEVCRSLPDLCSFLSRMHTENRHIRVCFAGRNPGEETPSNSCRPRRSSRYSTVRVQNSSGVSVKAEEKEAMESWATSTLCSRMYGATSFNHISCWVRLSAHCRRRIWHVQEIFKTYPPPRLVPIQVRYPCSCYM